MTNPTPQYSRPAEPHRPLGLRFLALIGLALLAVPRVVLHDLDLIAAGTFANALLVFLPPLIWIAVCLWVRVPNPFLTLLVVGAFYGVFLALGHQILWGISFADDLPRLGGNLAGIAPALQDIVFRVFAAVSSLFTGVLVGAIAGLIAWGIHAILPKPRA